VSHLHERSGGSTQVPTGRCQPVPLWTAPGPGRFPKPTVVLGQHVMVGPAGTVAGRTGAITSAADSLQIRLFGRGAHGSMPQASIDPVVMAAATVMRLQTVVSREVAA
jgi:metal-dependent amidase/aminoacylase/carboxypeptidase family protein